MSFEEKFDKIIKQKINEAEFPFDESNWQKASRMIDAERGAQNGARSSKYFLLFGGLFLVITTITFFSLTLGSNSNDPVFAGAKTMAAVNTNNSLSDHQNVSDGIHDLNNTVVETESDVLVKKTEVNTKTGGNPVAASDKNVVSVDHSAPASNDKSVNNMAAGKTTGNASKPSSSPDFKTSDQGPENAQKFIEKSSGNKKTKSSGRNKETSGSKNSTLPVLGGKAKNNALQHSGADQNDMAQNNTKLNLAAGRNNEAAKTEYDYLEMHSSVLQIWKKDADVVKTVYDFIRIYDEDYFVKKRRRTHFMNAELGTAYLFGWETAGGRDAKGFNAFGGINYGLYISRKASISIGAHVYNVSNIKQPFYAQASYYYDFGSNGNYTNITTNSLFYASLPIKVYYNISRTGKIGAGVNAGLLFNGRNTVETYTMRDQVKSNATVTKNTGYYEGLNTKNIMLSAFYNHRLNRRINLNGEMIFGISDTYKNINSGTNARERNIGVRLSLQYTLFDK